MTKLPFSGVLVLSLAATAAYAQPFPPGNDICTDWVEVFDGDTPFTTVGAATDGIPHAACNDGAVDDQVNQDVWFVYQANVNGTISVSVCDSNYDTKLAVYNGNDCPALEDNLLACNDDCCGEQSRLSFTAVALQIYLIRVGGVPSATGSGTLVIFDAATAIDDVRSEVTSLTAPSGPLTSGQSTSLTKKLDLSRAQIEIGKTTPAVNRLNAFINEVNATNGLSAAQKQSLIDAATEIVNAISC